MIFSKTKAFKNSEDPTDVRNGAGPRIVAVETNDGVGFACGTTVENRAIDVCASQQKRIRSAGGQPE